MSILLIFNCSLAFANMAYMGPAPGQVSGFNTGPNVRVLYEKLTADLRKFPNTEALVFADYKLMCTGNGKVQFLFVASSDQPVKPEIILDGKLIQATPIIFQRLEGSNEQMSQKQLDSLSDLIGYDLGKGNGVPHQYIQEDIFTFEVPLSHGMHTLKVGYTCIATAFEEGNLRYTVFPYFIGNATTKKQYDSIFVHVLLPENVDYTTNFTIHSKNKDGFVSANLAGFEYSHMLVYVFKNIEPELSNTWLIFQCISWALLVMLTLALLHFVRKRLIARKRIWTVFVLYIVPGSLVAAIVYYLGMTEYNAFFENKYGDWLRGSWGKGYDFLVVPYLFIMISIVWSVLATFYTYLIFNKKWDFMRFFDKKQRI